MVWLLWGFSGSWMLVRWEDDAPREGLDADRDEFEIIEPDRWIHRNDSVPPKVFIVRYRAAQLHIPFLQPMFPLAEIP